MKKPSQSRPTEAEHRGKRLEEAMKIAGISDTELAVRLGKSPKTIYNWRLTGNMDIDCLAALEDFLVVDVKYLLAGSQGFNTKVTVDHGQGIAEFESQVNLSEQFGVAIEQRERLLPVFETENIVDLTGSQARKRLEDWLENPSSATRIACSYTERIIQDSQDTEKLEESCTDGIGIPRFAIQIVVTDYDRGHIQYGDLVGFATDVVPLRKDFIVAAWQPKKQGEYLFVAGYFMPRGRRMSSANFAASYENLEHAVIRLDPLNENPDDTEINYQADNFEIIGVATWKQQWFGRHHQRITAGLINRDATEYKKRKRT